MKKPNLLTRIKTGDNFLTAWRQIEAELNRKTPKLLASPVLTKRVTPNGILVKHFYPDTWDHPFRVSASSELVKVSAGTVNGVLPYIDSPSGGYVRLNGLDRNGKFDFEAGIFPALKLTSAKVNADGGTYVMIKVKRNKTSNTFGSKIDDNNNITAYEPEDLEIVLEKEFEGPTAAGVDNEFGYHPIGYLQWNAKRDDLISCSQVCHFNLKYAFQDRRATPAEILKNPDQLTIGRHIFYPV